MLAPEHLAYIKERGANPERLLERYASAGSDLCILYCDPQGQPYLDGKGQKYVVRRLFPTGKPKFKAPHASGSRPYFSPLMPEGYLNDIRIPLVLIEGPIKVDSCYEHIPVGYCFVGLTGTWNIRDHRGEDGRWSHENDTRVLPELKAIPMKGRQVIVLFDSDIADNKSVAEAAKSIGNWSRKRGGFPHRVNLPSEPDGKKNGADDFLVRHGAEQLLIRLQQPKVIGWPLPAPLLTEDGDVRSDYDATEEQELIEAAAIVSDISVLDGLLRRISRKTSRKYDELLALVDDARAGANDQGFLCSDADLEQSDIDSKWIVPDVLPRGELIVIAADSGAGKSLLTYDLCRALIRGDKWLGFSVPKMRCLILQLEEGKTMSSRLTAFGFHHWSKRGDGWEAGQTFDLAKPRHRQQLTSLIASGFDFVMIDPLRAVSSLDIEENSSDIGKKVVRPLRRLITEAGASAVLIHHNSRHSGKYAGNGDIKAAVWGLFSLRRIDDGQPDELHLSSLEAHDGKTRDGDSILWRIRKTRCEGYDGSQGNCSWELIAMEQHDSPDLPLVKRFEALLASETEPRTLRQIAESLRLPPDGGKVNATLRVMAAKSAIIRRWAVKREGQSTTYWMPPDRRPASKKDPLPPSGALFTNQLTHTASPEELRVSRELTAGQPPLEQLAHGLTKTRVTPPTGGGGVPVYVDGLNGWTSPSGRIDKGEHLLLVDPSGVSRRIERKRVSLSPPRPDPDPELDFI